MTELRITVPGPPVAQGRGRAYPGRGRRRIVVVDPPASRSWKAGALHHYRVAMAVAGHREPLFPAGPVELLVVAVFPCRKGWHRKRAPAPRAPKDTRPDADNVLKAVKDAAQGVLWTDDAQVARVVVEKWRGAQGEAPRVEVTVRAWSAA